MEETFEIENAEYITKTDLAICINHEGKEYWIPYSQIVDHTIHMDRKSDRFVNLEIPMWIAEEEGMV